MRVAQILQGNYGGPKDPAMKEECPAAS